MKYLLTAIAFAATFFCAAQAQGLAGVAPEYILGRSDERTIGADRTYESWKTASVALTCLVTVAAACCSAKMLRRKGMTAVGKALPLMVSAPICTHGFGTVLVNNLWRWF